ncbi:MAG: PH domain-containing protein [Candidatus Solibacter sp.]
MDDLTIRPTAKFIMVRAIFSVLLFLAVEIAWYTQWRDNPKLEFVPIVAFAVLIWPLPGALRRQFTKTTITGDRLHHETGVFAKTTRTIQLSKLQDLRVDQTITQRMFRVGNLSIETAGAASWEAIRDVDNPQSVADEILNRAQHGPAV